MNPYSDLDTYVRRLHELERRDRASDLVNSLHTTDIRQERARARSAQHC